MLCQQPLASWTQHFETGSSNNFVGVMTCNVRPLNWKMNCLKDRDSLRQHFPWGLPILLYFLNLESSPERAGKCHRPPHWKLPRPAAKPVIEGEAGTTGGTWWRGSVAGFNYGLERWENCVNFTAWRFHNLLLCAVSLRTLSRQLWLLARLTFNLSFFLCICCVA